MFTPKHTDTIPWFKQPLVWLVIFFPAAAVIAGLITLAIAINVDDGVVVDDYYKKGKEINLVLTRDKQALALGLKGKSVYTPSTQHMLITVDSTKQTTLPDTIRLQLLHTTRGKIDIDIETSSAKPGYFDIALPAALAKGSWIVQVGTPEWRIHGRINIPNNFISPLQPL